MRSRHLIDELRVEIACRDEAAGLAGQARWESLWQRRLAVVAEDEFDAASRPGAVRRFDRIEVDLGDLPPDLPEAEAERRFRERLRAALDASAPTTGTVAAPEVLTAAAADAGMLRQFLLTGRLPWHGGGATAADADELMARVVRSGAGDFGQWLRDQPPDAAVPRRLARQMTAAAFDAAVRAVEPVHAARLALLRDRLEAAFAATAGPGGRSRARDCVREALLAVLLARAGRPFDVVALMREVVQRTARLLGGSHAGTAAALRDVVARLRGAADGTDGDGIARVLVAAAGGDPPAPSDLAPAPTDPLAFAAAPGELSETVPASVAGAAVSGPRRAIERALLGLDAVPDEGRWHVLIRDHGPLLEAAVRHHGQLVRVRRHLAEAFPEPMLEALAGLLEPAQTRFLVEVVHRPELFRPVQAPTATEAATLRRRTWEFTLGYLLVERGGRFNRQAYLGSVVRQMAAHDNLDHRTLLAAMIAALERLEARSALQEELVLLLRALAREVRAPEADGRAAAAAADAWETVADALLDGADGADETSPRLADAIARLARHPRSFSRLLRDLPSVAPAALAARLDDAALAALVHAWAAHLGTGGAGPAFAEALASAGAKAPNRRALHGAVLGHLLRGEVIDPDAIVDAMAGARPASARAPDAQASLAAWRERGHLDEDAAQTWSQLVTGQPAMLRAALQREAARSGGARALATLLAPRMLDDVVRLLHPESSAFVTANVAAMRRTATPEATGRSRREAGHDAWEFTLAWLLVDRGSVFNRRTWLAALVRHMAARSNRRLGELLAALLDDLAAAPLPGALQAEILDLLRTLARAEARDHGDRHGARRRGGRPRPSPPSRRAASKASSNATGAATADTLDALARWLREGAGPLPAPAAVERAVATASDGALRDLARAIEARGAVARLVERLPEALLLRLLLRLRPLAAAALLACAAIVEGAADDGAVTLDRKALTRLRSRCLWQWLVVGGRPADVAGFVRAFAARIAEHVPTAARSGWRARVLARLAEDRIAGDREQVRVIADALAEGGDGARAGRAPVTDAVPAPGEVIHVANAGMVLAAPYLPRLFGMVGLLHEGKFRDEGASARAVHLLEYLVHGAVEAPEHVLMLNKLLCGVPLEAPVPRDVALTDAERSAVDGLIGGIIANWAAIGRTSVAGLRESFLQREGRLERLDEAWHLRVEPRAFDMLLDRLPWSIATIRLGWMERVLHVEWR